MRRTTRDDQANEVTAVAKVVMHARRLHDRTSAIDAADITDPTGKLGAVEEDRALLTAHGKLNGWALGPAEDWLDRARQALLPVAVGLVLTVSGTCHWKVHHHRAAQDTRPRVEIPAVPAGGSAAAATD